MNEQLDGRLTEALDEAHAQIQRPAVESIHRKAELSIRSRRVKAAALVGMFGILSVAILGTWRESDSPNTAAETGSVESFNHEVSQGLDADYIPLASPDDAIERSDAILVVDLGEVAGTMVAWVPSDQQSCDQASESRSEQTPADGECVDSEEISIGRYVAIDSTVLDVVKADGISVGENFRLVLEVAPSASIENLRAQIPDRAVLMLVSEPEFPGFPTAQLRWSDGSRVEDSTDLIPFIDGVWFESPSGMSGPWVDADHLPSGWDSVDNVVDLTQQLQEAAKSIGS